MSNDIPDIGEFCFGPEAANPPDVMLAIWARTYLTSEQFAEFRRMVHEIAVEQPGIKPSVEQMTGLIGMAKFLAD